MATARDRFWFFGVRPHQDDKDLGRNMDTTQLNYRSSRITPAEGAFMLNVPNMIMVNCDGEPTPYSTDAYGYAESFCRMDKVLWCGAFGGLANANAGNLYEAFICDLATKYPNISGAFIDDLFACVRYLREAERPGAVAAQRKRTRKELDKACRPMELWVVWYTYEIDAAKAAALEEDVNGITLWTWDYHDLAQLEENYEKIEKLFPNKKKMLGIYMYYFPNAVPVPNDYMELQCELGLRLMREGRLDGMVFETNSVMGCGLASEKWLREWIDRVKDTEIPD